jgi:hypothetical protein
MGFLNRLKTPKATVSIAMDKNEFTANEPMTGRFQVTSSEEFDIDEIRMEIWVNEFTRATGSVDLGGNQKKTVTLQQNNKLHDGKVAVAGRMHIPEGFNKEFPFTINLPPGVPPSYRGRNATNTWKMKGVIAVKGRPDVTSHDTEVQVNS